MSATVADLFDTPVLPGLDYRGAIIGEAEERALIAQIDNSELSPFRFQQWTGKRLTHSYGWSYDFETGRFARADPFPNWLASLKARAARFAGLDPDDLVQALLIRYDPGAGIGWHKDRPVFEHVIGISLGSEAAMRFRRRAPKGFERVSVPLAPRSIYHLSGEVRHEWEHSIAPIASARWSVTFRSLADRGVRFREPGDRLVRFQRAKEIGAELMMANGLARDGAVQDQIDDTVRDAVLRARVMMPAGEGSDECDDCGEDIAPARRAALPGTRTCVACQSKRDATIRSVGINRRGSKDSQLR